jgi:hypothetical protein
VLGEKKMRALTENTIVAGAGGNVLGSLAVACCLVLGACGSPAELGDELLSALGTDPVQTDSLVYTLRDVQGGYDAWASATYRNQTGGTVFYKRCRGPDSNAAKNNPTVAGPMFGIGRAGPDSTRYNAVGWFWACPGPIPPGSIAPDEVVSVRVWLGSGDSPYANPPVTMANRTGTFRIYLMLCETFEQESDRCDLLPDEQRRSNVFEIRAPE